MAAVPMVVLVAVFCLALWFKFKTNGTPPRGL